MKVDEVILIIPYFWAAVNNDAHLDIFMSENYGITYIPTSLLYLGHIIPLPLQRWPLKLAASILLKRSQIYQIKKFWLS